MNGCLLWSLTAVCDGPCGYLRWAWRLSTMSMAAICDEHGGYLRWAWRLFVMSLVVVCDGTHAIIKKEK